MIRFFLLAVLVSACSPIIRFELVSPENIETEVVEAWREQITTAVNDHGTRLEKLEED